MSSRIARPKVDKASPKESTTQNTVPAQTAPIAANAAEDEAVSRRDGLKILMDNPENSGVIRKLIITTIVMFTLPFFMFYTFKNMDYAGMPLLHMYFRDRNLVGGIGALLTVQVIIMVYIYLAFAEPDERLDKDGKLKKD